MKNYVKLLQKKKKSDKLCKVKYCTIVARMKIIIQEIFNYKFKSLNLKPISGKIPITNKNKIEKRY